MRVLQVLVVMGGAATAAQLNQAQNIALDSSGNLFIADYGNHRIRKVDTAGNISTVAGTGTAGFGGDGGLATAAQLNHPTDVALDSNGNLFIADQFNNRIRKVDTAGNISTVAGTGTAGFNNDGVPAATAHLNLPSGIALDGSGDLYIADTNNHRIRKVDTVGNISTLAGIGTSGYSGDGGSATTAELSFPTGVVSDSSGNVLFTDNSNYRIRKIIFSNTPPVVNNLNFTANENQNLAQTLRAYDADGDELTYSMVDASSNGVTLITNNSTGAFTYTPNVDVTGTDSFTFQVYDGTVNSVIVTATITINPVGFITTVAGTGVAGFSGDGGLATSAQLNYPSGAALNSDGHLLIADYFNHRIRKVDTAGNISTIAGIGTIGSSGDGAAATLAQLYHPLDVALYSNDELLIADAFNNRIRKVNTTGIISTIAGTGTAGFAGDEDLATLAQLNQPHGVMIDGGNNIFIADRNNHSIRKINAAGIITTIAGTGTAGFSGDGGPATAAQLNDPNNIVLDSSGNLFIADYLNHRIRKVDTTGIITTIAGTGFAGYSGDGGLATTAELNLPRAIALDSNGNLLIADRGNHRIRKVDTAGNISTVAGNGTLGYNGDGGLATAARLYFPSGIAIDSNDNVFIVDEFNHRIRKVALNTPPVANNLSFTTIKNQSLTNLLSASDADGNALTYTIIESSTNGTTSLINNNTGEFMYTPNVDVTGTDSFTYQVYDGFEYSAIATVDITIEIGPPAAPSDFSAIKVTEQQVIMTWTENSNTDSFLLRRSDWPTSAAQALMTTAYTDNSVTCGQSYTYFLAAVNTFSQTGSAPLAVTTLPCPVNDFNATPIAANQITLNWNDATSSHTGYKLLRDNQLIVELANSVRSYNDVGLTCDTLYSYQLIQQTAQGDGNPLAASATTHSCPIPGTPLAPTNLSGTSVGLQTVNLNWTDNSNNETLFILTRDSEVIASLDPDSTHYVDNTVACGQTYVYSLLARNAVGDSVANTLSMTTPACATIQYTLTLNVEGQGTINNCGASCQQIHPANTQLSFTVQAAVNWTFSHWSGGCDANGHITLTADQSCTAHFTPIPITAPSPSPSTPAPSTPAGGNNDGTTTIRPGDNITGNTLTGEINNEGVIANVTIAEDSTVNGGTISSTVDNQGTLNNVTISQYSIVNGGNLGGTILNKGTLNDVNLLPDTTLINLDDGTINNVSIDIGSTIEGGKLNGLIKNEGTIQDVWLGDNCTVHNGRIGGVIQGEVNAPCCLGNVSILLNSRLTNTHLTPTAQLPEDVTIVNNVTFPTQPTYPTPPDFCFYSAQLPKAEPETLRALEPAAYSVLLPHNVEQLSPAALAGLDSAAVANMTSAAVAALSIEQFNALSLDALSGLTADNLVGLQPAVIKQLDTTQLAALDTQAVQNSDALTKILTNLNPATVDESVILALLPEDWRIDAETGVIQPPVGTTLDFRALALADLPDNLALPALPDIESALVIGGKTDNPKVRSLKDSIGAGFAASNPANFVLSQTETGILHFEILDTGTQLAFMPYNMVQVDPQQVPAGITQTEEGFYIITTPEGYQLSIIPTPQDPIGLVELLGETGTLQLSMNGDVWLQLEQDALRRSNRVHRVIIFDPFVEAAPSAAPGVYADRVVYQDATMQRIYPTLPTPELFIATAFRIPGVEDVILHRDGSYQVLYEGIQLRAIPTGNVQRVSLLAEQRILPSIKLLGDTLLYSFQENLELLETYFMLQAE